MTDVESELRAQFYEVFEQADYPVSNQMDLIPVLPDGPATKFEANGVTISAMELAAKLGPYQEFPYHSADDLVDDIMRGLKAEEMI